MTSWEGSESFFKWPSREIISVFGENLFQNISTDGPLWRWQLSSWLNRFESRRQKYLEDVVYLSLTWCNHGGGSAVALADSSTLFLGDLIVLAEEIFLILLKKFFLSLSK